MYKEIKRVFLATLLAVMFLACEGGDTESKNENHNKADTPTINNPSTDKSAKDNVDIDNNFQISPFLRKLGDNGTILDDKAKSWKITEIEENGLMIVKTQKYTDLSKDFSYDEAKEYCQNLVYAGFDNWRLPTKNEAISIMDIARLSMIELSYFPLEEAYASYHDDYLYFGIKSPDTDRFGYGEQGQIGSFKKIKENWHIADYKSNYKAICVRKRLSEEEKKQEKDMVKQLLTKIGKYGQTLDSLANNWDAIKLNNSDLMIENKSYALSLAEYTYDDAIKYCQNLKTVGYNDWRLASTEEINTIYNTLTYGEYGYGEEYLKNFFDGSKSSTWLLSKNYYHDEYYFFTNGNLYAKDEGYYEHTWCVRYGATKAEKLKKFVGLWEGDVIQEGFANTPIEIEIIALDIGEISGTVKYPQDNSEGNLILEKVNNGEYIFREKLTKKSNGSINNGLFGIKNINNKLVWRWWHETKSQTAHGVLERVE